MFACIQLAVGWTAQDQARLEQLMRLWSLKESFVKVDGFGLSFPLVRVAFAVEGGERRAGGGGEQNREQAAAVVMDATAMLDKTGCAARSTRCVSRQHDSSVVMASRHRCHARNTRAMTALHRVMLVVVSHTPYACVGFASTLNTRTCVRCRQLAHAYWHA